MKKALLVYSSNTGNTEKVAQAIQSGLNEANFEVTLEKAENAFKIDYFGFDLVCVGSPSIQFHPTAKMDEFLKCKMSEYRKRGNVKPSAPKVEGKNALIFVTYSGPHTGVDEAVPVGKYMAQFFAHLGFNVVGEWYVLGEFHGNEENSTKGLMGDIRGKPTLEELSKIKADAKKLAARI